MEKRTRNFLLTVLAMVVIVILMLLVNTFIQANASVTPTIDSSCPTADETSIPICAPGEEGAGQATFTPGENGPKMLGTPVGP